MEKKSLFQRLFGSLGFRVSAQNPVIMTKLKKRKKSKQQRGRVGPGTYGASLIAAFNRKNHAKWLQKNPQVVSAMEMHHEKAQEKLIRCRSPYTARVV